MKILSVIVPSYNSQAYLNHCIDTLLSSGEGIEILIVNDGSRDQTKEIANEYEKKYPGKVIAIHQENAGHGGAINAGLKVASGHYIKVVDSDDWVNPEVLRNTVTKLGSFIAKQQKVDMFITDFVYDKVGKDKKKVMSYRGTLPEDEIFTWKRLGRFRPGKYILMHSVIYSRKVLEDCQLSLPEHTFYVDNLFVYLPLPYVKTMYYMNQCLYHYFIGRDDQSVNEKNMIKRIDQQLKVNKLMIENVDVHAIKERSKRRYMIHYLNIVTVISTVFLCKAGSKDALQQKAELWRLIRKHDYKLHFKMKNSLIGSITTIPGRTGRKVTLYAYNQAQKRIGFN